MLEEFRVNNFKSLVNTTFCPKDINMLLGRNNSGKTNLCQALYFLGATAVHTLDKCADDFVAGGRFAMTSHHLGEANIDFHLKVSIPYNNENLNFEYDLIIKTPPASDPEGKIEVEAEKLIVTGGGFKGDMLFENSNKSVNTLNEKDHTLSPASVPADSTMLSKLYDTKTNPRAILFKDYLRSIRYYDLSLQSIRRSTHTPNRLALNIDGSNLTSVIYYLKMYDERRYRELLKHLQDFDPSIDIINFSKGSEDYVFMYFEDKEGHSLSVHSVSNGTLRFLAMVYVLLVQPSLELHPLIIIEEPENGIYVDMLRDILDMAQKNENAPQVIFTSHSPYLIDFFDSRLDSVFLLKRGKQHSTILNPSVEKVKARLSDFSLGEQYFREMLG